MAWDDVLVDGVDTINALRWNGMVTDQNNRSLSSHTHTQFAEYPYTDWWYVYTDGTTYYAKNLSTGTIDYSGTDFSTVMNLVIAAITNSGFIKLGTGLFTVKSQITTGDKVIIIDGNGWGRGGTMTDNPGTLLKTTTTGSYYLLQFGTHGSTLEGAGIRNCMIMNDPANTVCYGAVDLYNTVNCFVDHCYIYGFELGSVTPMPAVSIRGATDEQKGGWNNRVTNCHILKPDVGILLGSMANYNLIEGNNIVASGTASANGIKFDGTGAPAASPLGCLVAGNTFDHFNGGTSRGIWVTPGYGHSGRHTIIGNVFTNNGVNVEITSGTDIGECTFIGNNLGAATFKMKDGGDTKSYFYNNKNYVNENFGAAASVADGGTITHGLDTTPTVVNLTGTIANEVITCTAKGTTTFTVAIKKYTGSWVSGTTQTIYWRAGI